MNASTDNPTDLLGAVIGALSEGLAVFDEDAALIFCNDAYRDCNPLVADLITAGSRWDLLLRESVTRGAMTPQTRERIQRLGLRIADGGPPAPPLEYESLNGSVHEIAMRRTATGGFVVSQRDITERRRYEESEREAEALLGMVLEACPANLVMSRVGDGRILYRSPAATQLLGPIRTFHEHFASRAERADFVTALLPDGRVDDMLVTACRPDGSQFPCLLSARLIEYRGDEVVVSSSVDISKEVALRKTLGEQREQIFQAEKMSALGELLAGVAHELNNPLSVVVGHAMMMREEASDPDTLRRIDKISTAAERCTRIVKSFLAMAREQPLRLAAIDLKETLEMAIDALRQGADGLETHVAIDVPDALPAVRGDAHQLAQVVINLVTNADQAIRSSGVGDTIRISAHATPGSAAVEFSVSDNGPGVPEAIRGRIFDPLFTTKEVGQGTGIGLAFCHRVVTAHEGAIRLEAGEPGATFVVSLPVARDVEATSQETIASESGQSHARVLIVEDEPAVADLISEILGKEGFAVDCADSGEAALALVRTRNYALILSDLNMPGVGGKGFYETVVSLSPALARRIAFVTGDTMSPKARGFLDNSGQPYLEKPIAPQELRRLVSQMLTNPRSDGGAA
ncbi:MAG: ATP-binding protein [Pseudomonadota bacterium]|jgi:C4-dicarboxylate-specific signal transduction histidine kinase/ActR/RegA family two-component response regulator